ncbi:4Fe-4S ferredoxin-type domain-containing protein [Bordetella sputigena]|uniref:4Fe-4S dicluster domain-containing protein n=1 Tax=Bordetella sputigena TaxID=1416810 RepID=UPI0039F1166F
MDIDRIIHIARIDAEASGGTTLHAAAGARDTHADGPEDPARRALLKWMAAAGALATAGCSGPPSEAIVPYAHMPEGGPGDEPVFYASAVTRGGYAVPVLVETHMGRPTKIEGNPGHPMSDGATDACAQAAILQLWDPDRSRAVMRGDGIADWPSARNALAERIATLATDGGAGLRVLTGASTSPTMERQLDAAAARFPGMRRHRHDPLHDAAAQAGARRVLGYPAHAWYRLDRARVVLAVGADLFIDTPAGVRYARDFARGRGDADKAAGASAASRVPAAPATPVAGPAAASLPRLRLYAIEAMPGLTGAMADQRWVMTPGDMGAMLRRLAHALGVPGVAPASGKGGAWETALAEALKTHAGAALVAPGPALSADDHALAWAINTHLGAVGQCVMPVATREVPGLAPLIADMRDGNVDTLLIIDANPVYDSPDRQAFADALRRVPLSVHQGLYRDETALACAWHVPRAHELECWSDALAWDGTPTIMQPMIAPLHNGVSPHALLQVLADGNDVTDHDAVRATWRAAWPAGEFDARWRAALRTGHIQDAGLLAPLPSGRRAGDAAGWAAVQATSARPGTLVAQILPDPYLGGGAASNNAWLQELPRPLTRMTWDNAVYMDPETARAYGLAAGDVVSLTAAHGASVEGPVHILPGHAPGMVTLHLGYGRRHAGRVGDGVGFDAYTLQARADDGTPLPTVPVTLAGTGRTHRFAYVQTELSMHGRDIVRVEDLQSGPREAGRATPAREARAAPSLYPKVEYPDYAWAMTIDLDKCIGCNACTVACQAENNIPVVGAGEVRRGREMHWIRVDVYRERRETLFQPVPCMHCEDAPCEPVCPVGATVHDSEGLNAQVYNRCVGTRFCSNNCPYKVRRFNFFEYSDRSEASAAHQNPDVTVRQRGVMEKCTYCVQRISRARIQAQKEDRTLRDGEVVTACEAVCPSQAIVFGNLNDPASRVNATRGSPRAYALLEELNTHPRTRYLARQRDSGAKLEPDDG